MVCAACVAAVVGGTCGRPAFAQTANWTGGTSTDYFDGSNWSTSAAPVLNQQVDIQTPATFMPSYTGDNTGNQTGQFSVMPGATFGMTSGTFQTDHMYIANNNTVGSIATFTMTSGSVRVNGDFRTSRILPSDLTANSGISGTNAAYNQSGGFLYVNSANQNNEASFANTSNNIQVVSLATITGGTFMSNGRISFGASPGNITNTASYVKMTMSGGVMAATNISQTSGDGRGTLAFQAGDITLSGGILRGTDLSSRDGVNVGSTAVPNAGIKMNGGVMQINTNEALGVLYVVPNGVAPGTVTGVPMNRGQFRMLGGSLALNEGVAGVLGSGRGYSELTTVGGTTTYIYPVRVWMTTGTNDAGQAKNQANGFASNPGDYNLDGKVNQADYNYAQSQFGNTYMNDPLDPTGSLVPYYGADGNGDGTVTQADIDIWNALYGQRTTGGVYAWATPVSIAVASGTQAQTAAGYSNLSFTTASSVTKTGGGTLVLDQVNSMTGTVTIQGGAVQISGTAAAYSASFTPAAGGTLTLAPYLQTTVDGLDPLAGGLTDVGNGMITVSRGGLSVANMVSAIQVGYNGGAWNGTSGIGSTAVAAANVAAGATVRAVGWLENADGSVTFAFAAPGDVNLDGQIDVLDAATIAGGGRFNDTATWALGDFNYDGIYDDLDNALFVATNLFDAGPYNAPPGAVGGIAAVPEPSAAAIVIGAMFAVAVARRGRVGSRS
jgi:autotransporter-associated beta strand protein